MTPAIPWINRHVAYILCYKSLCHNSHYYYYPYLMSSPPNAPSMAFATVLARRYCHNSHWDLSNEYYASPITNLSLDIHISQGRVLYYIEKVIYYITTHHSAVCTAIHFIPISKINYLFPAVVLKVLMICLTVFWNLTDVREWPSCWKGFWIAATKASWNWANTYINYIELNHDRTGPHGVLSYRG